VRRTARLQVPFLLTWARLLYFEPEVKRGTCGHDLGERVDERSARTKPLRVGGDRLTSQATFLSCSGGRSRRAVRSMVRESAALLTCGAPWTPCVAPPGWRSESAQAHARRHPGGSRRSGLVHDCRPALWQVVVRVRAAGRAPIRGLTDAAYHPLRLCSGSCRAKPVVSTSTSRLRLKDSGRSGLIARGGGTIHGRADAAAEGADSPPAVYGKRRPAGKNAGPVSEVASVLSGSSAPCARRAAPRRALVCWRSSDGGRGWQSRVAFGRGRGGAFSAVPLGRPASASLDRGLENPARTGLRVNSRCSPRTATTLRCWCWTGSRGCSTTCCGGGTSAPCLRRTGPDPGRHGDSFRARRGRSARGTRSRPAWHLVPPADGRPVEVVTVAVPVHTGAYRAACFLAYGRRYSYRLVV